MAVQLTPELEQRLEQIACETQSSPEALTQAAVQALVEDYEEQVAAVKEADERFARGEFLPHEEVVALFRKRFAKA